MDTTTQLLFQVIRRQTAQGYNTILNGTQNSAGTRSDYSTILGGQFNWVNADGSAILAGLRHHVNANTAAVLAGYNHHMAPTAVNSSILAGQDIYAYSADTSYTNLLNVQSAMTSTTITQFLVRELDPKQPGGFGAIKVRNIKSFGGPTTTMFTGGLITGDTQFEGVVSACTLVTSNVTACGTGLDFDNPISIILASPTQVTSGFSFRYLQIIHSSSSRLHCFY